MKILDLINANLERYLVQITLNQDYKSIFKIDKNANESNAEESPMIDSKKKRSSKLESNSKTVIKQFILSK